MIRSTSLVMEHTPPAPALPARSLRVFGVRADIMDGAEALSMIRRYAAYRHARHPHTVYFTNVHTVHLARRDPDFRACIDRADLVLPDGIGLQIAGKAFGHPIRENLNGTDLAPRVLRAAEKEGWTVYLLGARPAVLDVCRRNLMRRFPDLLIVGWHHGYFSQDEEEIVLRNIDCLQPDILLVALGSPRQEKWLVQHAARLQTSVCFAVGGLFDFISGTRKRAPVWMRRWGVEWLYRFIQDPWSKWDRIFVEIPWFLAQVFALRAMPRSLRTRLLHRDVVHET